MALDATQSTEDKTVGDRNVAIWKGDENTVDGARKLRTFIHRIRRRRIIFVGHNKEGGFGEFDTHKAHIDLIL